MTQVQCHILSTPRGIIKDFSWCLYSVVTYKVQEDPTLSSFKILWVLGLYLFQVCKNTRFWLGFELHSSFKLTLHGTTQNRGPSVPLFYSKVEEVKVFRTKSLTNFIPIIEKVPIVTTFHIVWHFSSIYKEKITQLFVYNFKQRWNIHNPFVYKDFSFFFS